jgi:hypothetical protein
MENNQNKIVLLHWIGRFGNRMFQYAFGCSYAKKFNCIFYIPSEWEGTVLFTQPEYCKIITDDILKPLLLKAGCNHELNNFNLYNDNPCEFDKFTGKVYSYMNPYTFHEAINDFRKNNTISKYSYDAKLRGNIIFRELYPDNPGFESLGLFLLASFDFGPEIYNITNNYLKQIIPNYPNICNNKYDKKIIIGLHSRHQPKMKYEHNIDTLLLNILKDVRITEKEKECIVLFATDRPETISMFRNFTTSINCKLVYLEKENLNYKKISGGTVRSEHGIYCYNNIIVIIFYNNK